ncbi:hypothetical protein BC832DRAFT_620779 [Gaertneriomyces semiglobifer]|nr:hypothetical protein BC832DRAFT_620779 [Gaertneriomyces semiglobifer]
MEIKRIKVPRENQIKYIDKTPPDIPLKKFFCLSICGSSRSGKTTCMVNLIENLSNAYTSVIIFTPSIQDDKWASLKKKDNVFIGDLISNHVLHNLFERQKALYNKKKEENSMLIAIDDFGILARQSGEDISKPLKKEQVTSSGIKQMLDILYSCGRHFGVSLMASFHDVLQLTPLQRVNNTAVILYRLNRKQYEKIAPELRCHLSERDFIDLMDEHTIQPFSFVLVNLKAPRNEDVFVLGGPKA